MLPYLCVEVLQEIGSQLANCDQKNLRAVCKELNLAIDPLFYTLFVLQGSRIRAENGLHILERLAAGQIGWSHHCKTVHIRPGSRALKGEDDGPKWYPSNSELPNLLVTAISSMQNVQTVVWNVQASDPRWVTEAICDSLNTLPLLSELQLKMNGICHLQLTPLPRLTKLRIENSNWHRALPWMEEVCQVIGRGHNLTSLHLAGYDDWSKVWTMLRAIMLRPSASTRIYLKELTTSIVTPDLLAYLSSYSGVERLSLERGGQPKNDALADTFFNDVLTQHAQSLVELNCPACHEGRWSFRVDIADAVLQLRKLKKLHLSVNSADTADVEPEMNAVTLLLNTAALLPALRALRISPAPGRFAHGHNGIKTAIEDFTSHLESAAIVCTGESYYGLSPAVSDEGDRSTVLVYRLLDPTSPAVKRIDFSDGAEDWGDND
ncbi:hypothetical protein DFH08DRAFT_865679 [Mycena albidolilacea]|uniref:F-box domain-containing protein n=1 Tax=Mycena albidolilacea TaxID=1033008 RepID=A0AAD7A2I5_9AGAR|nr:hypothetical protein DFH08DRAFT_865679 [Mycena albidolilacea]